MRYGNLVLACIMLATTGCRSIVNPLSTANELEVSVNKASYLSEFDTFTVASEHCRRYGRLAVLERAGKPTDLLLYVDKYRCVKV